MTNVTLLDRHQIAGGYENFGPGIEPKFVTHSDYRALEEDRYSWRRVAESLELNNGALRRELAAMLRQAADEAEDAARYRWLVEQVFYAPDRFRCIAIEELAVDLRGKPGQSGGDLLTSCIDTARTQEKARD
jgi:hypothetical protein